MKDLRGYELNVGDNVVVTARNYRHLVEGVVTKLTPHKALVSYLNTWNYPSGPGCVEAFYATKEQVLKIGPAQLPGA